MSTLVVLAVLGFTVLGFFQGRRPHLPELAGGDTSPPGYATVTMILSLMDAQLQGFGGWLPNDLPVSPSYLLDNTTNYQLGVLQVARHATRVLRDNLSRQRTSDAVNRDVDLGYSSYANDPYKWAFPSAESAFSRGSEALLRFRDELGQGAAFYPRADNLVQLLEALVSELGAVNTQLLQASQGKVSWFKIDDNFYWAQGVRYGMLGLARALQRDFSRVLADKNAEEIMALIVQSLEAGAFDPAIVTNGAKSGVLANHSSNLKAFLDDARQKMNSLITILRQG